MRGNALVGQSGGPTSVINSSLCGVIQQALKSESIDNVYGMRFGIEGFMKNELIDLGREEQNEIEKLKQTPSSILGSCRYKVKNTDFPHIMEQLKKYNIRYFFLIGGNDTMDTIHRIEKFCKEKGYDLSGIGIPKTVDNDLYGTDHTPGYASAARYIALSVRQAGRLACDMQRVDRYAIFQTVGREAGWLAAASALAKKKEHEAPHIIYMPERRLTRERIVADAVSCIEKYGWVYIVCGEGILFEDGSPVSASKTQDKFSNTEFGAMGGTSAAMAIHSIISQETGHRGEFQITESLPMCAIDRASKIDLDEAYQCGVKAVELAEQGISGVMVSIKRIADAPYKIELETVALAETAVRAKPMPDEYISQSGNWVTDRFISYARPLIGDLPEFSSFNYIHL